jgi:hypothetical protein
VAQPLRPQTSEILRALVTEIDAPEIAVGELIVQLRARAYGVIFIILALVSLVPAMSVLGGVLIAVFAVQMAAGVRTPRLPQRLAELTIPTGRLRWAIERLLPGLAHLERHVRPRLPWLTAPPMINAVGLVMALISVTFALPVPFTQLPPGLAILLIAVSMLERDGRMLLLGLAASGAALAVGYFAIRATGRALGLW